MTEKKKKCCCKPCIFAAVAVVAVIAIAYSFYSGNVIEDGAGDDSGMIVGGDKDEHGCIGSAGYSWCPSTQKCQRMWEEYCEEFKENFRVVDFESCAAAGNPIMESYPRQCSHEGKTYAEDVVSSEPEQPSGSMMYPDDCYIEGGRTVKQEIGCASGESEIGEVSGFSAPTVCCAFPSDSGKKPAVYCTEEQKQAEICTMEYAPVCGYDNSGTKQTYGNKCGACAAGSDYWVEGEC